MLNKRCLRIVYNDNISSFEDQFDRDKSVSIHVKNVQTLALEMLKVSKNFSALILRFLQNAIMFTTCEIHLSEFVLSKINSVFHGKECISYLGPQIWNIVPLKLKH